MFLIFLFSYIIEDDQAGRNYIVSLNSSVCLSHNQCLMETVVVDRAVMPKPACNWDADFIIPGESKQIWVVCNMGRFKSTIAKISLIYYTFS